MSKNLAVDLGNSSVKLYVFDDDKLIDKYRYDSITQRHMDNLLKSHSVENCIVSSVRRNDADIVAYLEQCTKGKFVNLDYLTPMPITIGYGTPQTLGHDRIAVAVGAYAQSGNKASIVIDLGTAMTLDVIDASGCYLGGNIAPGLTTRFRALNDYTEQLPLIDANGDIPPIGNSTLTAMRSGVVRGMAHEINGFIAEMNDKIGKFAVYITGGDSKYLAKWIKYPIFDDQNLLAKGLNTILLYNVR